MYNAIYFIRTIWYTYDYTSILLYDILLCRYDILSVEKCLSENYTKFHFALARSDSNSGGKGEGVLLFYVFFRRHSVVGPVAQAPAAEDAPAEDSQTDKPRRSRDRPRTDHHPTPCCVHLKRVSWQWIHFRRRYIYAIRAKRTVGGL